jgi:hypothetical protein
MDALSAATSPMSAASWMLLIPGRRAPRGSKPEGKIEERSEGSLDAKTPRCQSGRPLLCLSAL